MWHFTKHRKAENCSSPCLHFTHGHSKSHLWQGFTLPLALTAVSSEHVHLNNGAVDDYAACDTIISVIHRQAASPISLTGTLRTAKGRSRVRNATASSSAGVQVKHRLALCIAILASIMVQHLCMARSSMHIGCAMLACLRQRWDVCTWGLVVPCVRKLDVLAMSTAARNMSIYIYSSRAASACCSGGPRGSHGLTAGSSSTAGLYVNLVHTSAQE